MTDDTIHDFTIGVDWIGNHFVIEMPVSICEMFPQVCRSGSARVTFWPVFTGMPDESGVYRIIATIENVVNYLDAPSPKIEVDFAVIQYEPMRLVPSGAFVPVDTESTR